jgi:hypothetical protein
MDSAPDPRRQAQSIHSELARVEEWTPAEQKLILAFGVWLADRPPIKELRPHTRGLLTKLGGR